jgi:site-specific DNA-methyltransferase (adenine-specific)
MSDQARFTLRSRNPDVLTCIANLSNDEVFTPPEFANRMLDKLADAWAANHGGASIWADKTVKFLDPCTKSGVFLREIASRLVQGLENEIPGLDQRVSHILTKQIFGIGITRLTSLLARRSVYCSKHAKGSHSIAKGFMGDDGNIWFDMGQHTWIGGAAVVVAARGKKVLTGGRCRYCGAGQTTFDRARDRESHAYALIHTDNPKALVRTIFGADMQFDVVVGNPPYQIEAEGNTRTMPIYQKFVEAAISLDARYVMMITPSRWFAGGLGLDEFRERMLHDKRIRVLVDLPDAGDVFPGVEIKGGVSYFLWDAAYSGLTSIQTVRAGVSSRTVRRSLAEFDVLVRESDALPILRKVIAQNEAPLAEIVSAQKPFGLLSNFDGYTQKRRHSTDCRLYAVNRGKRIEAWVPRSAITMNIALAEPRKVLIPEAGSDGGKTANDVVLGKPWTVPGDSVCTQTFMFIPVNSETAARSVESYLATRFARFLVSLRKISQHTKADTYRWVPQQKWNRIWTDQDLYNKYKLTTDEIEYVERMIRPMSLTETGDDE